MAIKEYYAHKNTTDHEGRMTSRKVMCVSISISYWSMQVVSFYGT